jgi:uncharacterized membrane protein
MVDAENSIFNSKVLAHILLATSFPHNMNEEQRLELKRIREEQRVLLEQANRLDRRIGVLESAAALADLDQRLEALEKEAALTEKAPAPAPASELPPPLPPPLPTTPPILVAVSPEPPAPVAPSPTPPKPTMGEFFAANPAPVEPSSVEPSSVQAQKEAVPPKPPREPESGESLEMRIGSVWLVRAAIFMLLTALVFGGALLYQNVIPHLGPGGKVGLLYLAAGALTGLGVWLERSRQARESASLLNYARVVLAGGLAAVYYVTYAAHHYDNLRVIGNPILAGLLLLGWTAFMTWLADRRNSQTLAAFSILLAYYTSATSGEVAAFTLFANLALTAAAVFLLRRRRWTAFSFASLAATFGSYFYWRYFVAQGPSVAHANLWIESGFLACYWGLFTFAAFFDESQTLDTPMRKTTFVSLNNGAFFALVSILVGAKYPDVYWRWPLLLGIVLLALGEGGRRLRRPLDARTADAYTFEGVSLVTLGLLLYFSEWQLALILAVESAIILAAAGRRESRWLFAESGLVALIAFILALDQLGKKVPGPGGWIAGLSGGAILVFNAWYSQRLREKLTAANQGGQSFAKLLTVGPGYFSFLGLAIWLVILEQQITVEAYRAPVLALAAVALTASIYLLRLPAVAFFGQFYLAAAYCHWMGAYGWTVPAPVPPVWNPLVLLGATLAIAHWWQQQRQFPFARPIGVGYPALNAFGFSVLLWIWLQPRFSLPVWTALASLLSLAILAYGVATDFKKLAVAGQLLLLAAVITFFDLWARGYPLSNALWAAAPMTAILLTIAAGRRLLASDPLAVKYSEAVSAVYEVFALVLFVMWTAKYFPRWEQFPIFAAGGALTLVAACFWREARWMLWSGAATVASLCVFLMLWWAGDRHYGFHFLGVAAIMAEQQFGRRWSWQPPAFTEKIHTALMTVATLCAWGMVSNVLTDAGIGGVFSLAAGWSIFAAVIFALGLVLRERIYRWLGLLLLGCTLGRVVLIDIWHLDRLQQFLSALALGLVLLGIGFFYTKYQNKLKNWF